MRLVAVVALAILAAPAGADFGPMPPDVPLERIEENVKAFLETHPDDANAHYVLGRVYAIAYATDAEAITGIRLGTKARLPVLDRYNNAQSTFLPEPADAVRAEARRLLGAKDEPNLDADGEKRVHDLVAALDADDFEAREEAAKGLRELGAAAAPALRKALAEGGLSSEQETRIRAAIDAIERAALPARCLARAIEEYRAATEKAPSMAIARLGLGWALDQAGRTDEAIAEWRKAYQTAAQSEVPRKTWTRYRGSWHASVGLEAGERLLAAIPADDPDRAAIEQGVAKLRESTGKASQYVTPILVPLGGEATLGALLDPARLARFDLVGDGRVRRWPWVREGTGVLVWDPRRAGRVADAKQLFGGLTWYIPFEDGYQPLRWLDDDRDGVLRRAELAGLAVWRDRGQDGVAAPGEVVPVEEAGIRAIGIRGEIGPEGPWCPRGVEFAGGAVAPTWDWMPQSVPEE